MGVRAAQPTRPIRVVLSPQVALVSFHQRFAERILDDLAAMRLTIQRDYLPAWLIYRVMRLGRDIKKAMARMQRPSSSVPSNQLLAVEAQTTTIPTVRTMATTSMGLKIRSMNREFHAHGDKCRREQHHHRGDKRAI
jgi:hypothetical protein